LKRFVLDASVALCWYFEDQKTPYTEAVFDCLGGGDEALVPAVWPLEVLNSLVVAWRQKSISSTQFDSIVDELADYPIEMDAAGGGRVYSSVVRLSRQYQLSSYDATYLELALYEDLPLATLDKNLRAAAKHSGVELFDPSHQG